MSIDLSKVTGISDSRGAITEIKDSLGRVIWAVSGDNVVLQVEKITSDTYAGETTYTGEQFILLDIYPKTNGIVNVTYGGLTKTITDTSGAAEPNAQKVFFGTFNGVSDSAATPASGKLTIEGDCRGFGAGSYSKSAKDFLTPYCSCLLSVDKWGKVDFVPNGAFYDCTKLTSLDFSDDITSVGNEVFGLASELTSVKLPEKLVTIGDNAFASCPLQSVEIPENVTNIGRSAFYCTITELQGYTLKTVKLLPKTPPVLTITPSDDGDCYINFGMVDDEDFALESIIVPKGCGATYKQEVGWSTYASYIVEES